MYENKHLKSQWIEDVKQLLCQNEYSEIWYTQRFINTRWMINSFRQKLNDIFIQNGTELLMLTPAIIILGCLKINSK